MATPRARYHWCSSFALGLIAALVLSSLPFLGPTTSASDSLILRVGGLDEMKTRNSLPVTASDVWTRDVLDRAFDRPVKLAPDESVLPYLAKGIDANENGIFERAEYGTWREWGSPVTPLEVTAYYDFNGVRWHDGVQMTVWDLAFAYHLNAMNPRMSEDFRVLFCSSGASYETCGRQLGVIPLGGRAWEGEGQLPGDPALRVAVRLTLTGTFIRFEEGTLAPNLFPMHGWSGTARGRHSDFGCAIWVPPTEATAKAIPACGTTDGAKWGRGIASTETVPGSTPYDYVAAERWVPTDTDVVGSGPFRFLEWVPGSHASVRRYEDYYVGGAFDPQIARYLHLPHTTGIDFVTYRTTQQAVFALNAGEVDFLHWSIDPGFVPDLVTNPEIGIEANAEPGFFYMAYNFRREPWGYEGGDPAAPDIGFPLRQAIARLVDKQAIVKNLLQNFGVIAWGPVSPSNTFWYNDNIPKPAYDLATAAAILDSPEARAVGIGEDPPGECSRDNPAGCRSLARIGTTPFEILLPQSDYDPVRASAGAMIGDAMRRVGLNANAKPMAFGALIDRIAQHDYDLYVLGWRITSLGDPTGYLYGFFGCLTNGRSLNGYCSPVLDDVLRRALVEPDRVVRQGLVFQAQMILTTDRPVEFLYYRTNIEAYRMDSWVNWSPVGGTIWNEWSLFGIRPPGAAVLHLTITAPSALPAETSESVRFTVRDEALRPLGGASIAVRIESVGGGDPGTLTSATETGTSLTLVADAQGSAAARYDAPAVVVGETRPILLHATATHESSQDVATRETVMNVVGRDLEFFQVRLTLPAGDLAYPEVALPVRLEVRDGAGAPLSEARVAVRLQPAGESSFVNGSADEGKSFFVKFPAPGIYTIRADVTDADFVPYWTYVTVWVIEPPDETRPLPRGEDRHESPALAVAFLAATSLVVGVTVVWRWRRIRRHR